MQRICNPQNLVRFRVGAPNIMKKAILILGGLFFLFYFWTRAPNPTNCEAHGILDTGGMNCSSIVTVEYTKQGFNETFKNESAWGRIYKDPLTGDCTISYVGEEAKAHELAHAHCGPHHSTPGYFDKYHTGE